MPSLEDYTVGWTCLSRTDYIAARVFLEETHDEVEHVSPSVIKAYTLGKIGALNIAILETYVCFGHLLDFTKHMLQLFHSLNTNLVIGRVCKDSYVKLGIRLDDTMVLAPVVGKGVHPPKSLQPAVDKLKTLYESQGHRLEEVINEKIEENPNLLKNYSLPKLGTDQLCKWESGTNQLCKRKSGFGTFEGPCSDNLSRLVLQPEWAEGDGTIAIHYIQGTQRESTGNKRQACGSLNSEYDHSGVRQIKFEVPGPIIRRTCTPHDLNVWQAYAAAAFIRDLYYQISSSSAETATTSSFQLENALTNSQNILHSRIPQGHYEEPTRQSVVQLSVNPQNADTAAYANSTTRNSGVRPCYIMCAIIALIIIGSGFLGIYYTARFDRMGDGFTAASWIVAIGALALGGPAARHYPHCRCWDRNRPHYQSIRLDSILPNP